MWGIVYLMHGLTRASEQISDQLHALLHISERYNTMQVMSVTVILDAFEIYQIYRIIPQKENKSQKSENKHAVL